jgi:hypothetical protein
MSPSLGSSPSEFSWSCLIVDVVAAAFSFGGYPHSPEFPCKSGQRYLNKQEGKGNRMDKKRLVIKTWAPCPSWISACIWWMWKIVQERPWWHHYDYVTIIYYDFISYLCCIFIILLIVLLYKCVVYCPRAKVALEMAFTSWVKTLAHRNCTWETLKLKQCLFNPRLHSRLKNSATYGLCLKALQIGASG